MNFFLLLLFLQAPFLAFAGEDVPVICEKTTNLAGGKAGAEILRILRGGLQSRNVVHRSAGLAGPQEGFARKLAKEIGALCQLRVQATALGARAEEEVTHDCTRLRALDAKYDSFANLLRSAAPAEKLSREITKAKQENQAAIERHLLARARKDGSPARGRDLAGEVGAVWGEAGYFTLWAESYRKEQGKIRQVGELLRQQRGKLAAAKSDCQSLGDAGKEKNTKGLGGASSSGEGSDSDLPGAGGESKGRASLGKVAAVAGIGALGVGGAALLLRKKTKESSKPPSPPVPPAKNSGENGEGGGESNTDPSPTGAGSSPESAPGSAPSGPAGKFSLIFFDEFDGTSLDKSKWSPYSPQYPEMYYGPCVEKEANTKVANGKVALLVTKESINGQPYACGNIFTHKSFSMNRGVVEARLKGVPGRGLIAALWLLPTDRSWPPEIDIVELLGRDPKMAPFTYHYKNGSGEHKANGGHYWGEADLTTTFHTYTLQWEPGKLTWWLDGVKRFETSESITTKPMYLIMDVGVGSANDTWTGPPDSSTKFPAQSEMDYIRVWKAD